MDVVIGDAGYLTALAAGLWVCITWCLFVAMILEWFRVRRQMAQLAMGMNELQVQQVLLVARMSMQDSTISQHHIEILLHATGTRKSS